MLRCSWATVIARGTARVNGPKSVAICSQLYVMTREYVNSQTKSRERMGPGLCLVPCILNQSEAGLRRMGDTSHTIAAPGERARERQASNWRKDTPVADAPGPMMTCTQLGAAMATPRKPREAIAG
jgi:hypothetical protein